MPNSPKVLRLMELTKQPRESVLGTLWIFWAWVDNHAKDGALRTRDIALLSQIVGVTVEFLNAMRDPSIKWLVEGENGLTVPAFEKWFRSEEKKREQNRKRQKDFRSKTKVDQVTEHNATSNAARNVTSRVTSPLHNAPDEDETRRDEDETETKTLSVKSSGTSNRKSAPTSTPTSGESSALAPDVGALEWEGGGKEFWTAAKELAAKISNDLSLPGGLKEGDRSALLKVAVLRLLGKISEDELWDSVASTVAKFKSKAPPEGTRIGYWNGAIRNKLQDRGVVLNTLLVKIKLPPRTAVTA